MFGLDLSFVILVPERKRGIDTGIQENFDSLFDLDIRVKPEYDRKGNRLRLGYENDRKFFCKPRNCREGVRRGVCLNHPRHLPQVRSIRCCHFQTPLKNLVFIP